MLSLAIVSKLIEELIKIQSSAMVVMDDSLFNSAVKRTPEHVDLLMHAQAIARYKTRFTITEQTGIARYNSCRITQ